MSKKITSRERDDRDKAKVFEFAKKVYLKVATFNERYAYVMTANERSALQDVKDALKKLIPRETAL